MQESFEGEVISPLPRISFQAFCDTPAVARAIELAAGDRRMEKTHASVQEGGIDAALKAFENAPTPNVIILETTVERLQLMAALTALSEFCDAGTKVVVIGAHNDIRLYRDLMAQGVSEYAVGPIEPLDFVRLMSRLYSHSDAEPLGKIIAVTGAKGGCGASVIAHNVAYSIARDLHMQTVIVDADLGFGTAGLDFNQDPPQGVAEAVFAPDRLDTNLLDRLLSRCTDRLSVLAAPATLDRQYDFNETAFDLLIDILRTTTPVIVLDVPHMWTGWTRRMLVGADEIILATEPTLAGMRNTKSLVENLRAARPHDAAPRLVLNMVGVPKRPEIGVSEFVKATELKADIVLPFDPKLFGTAANNGQMLVEVEAANKIVGLVAELARNVTGKAEIRRASKNILKPFVAKLTARKKAS